MAEQVAFDSFSASLAANDLTDEELHDYIEVDPNAPVVSLRFREEMILDEIPESYDLNEEVFQLEKVREQQFRVGTRDKTVVAEGDSWFNLPQPWRPRAIADNLVRSPDLDVENIARWGHTLAYMLDKKEYLREIEDSTQYFLLSGGGNDLQEGLATGDAIHDYDPDRPKDQYLTDLGVDILQKIEDDTMVLLNEVKTSFPHVLIRTHGYDYPRVIQELDQYIWRYFDRQGFPNEDEMKLAIDPIIDNMNERIRRSTEAVSDAEFLNCRGATANHRWYDDMHPHKEGFIALAKVFEDSL